MPKPAAFVVSGLAVAACLAAVPAHAQALTDTYWVEVGAYWADFHSSARVEPSHPLVPGTTINFESDLDLDDSDALPSITAGMRLGGKWSIEAEYYSLGREGSRSIDRTIRFDDTVFNVNAGVSARFDSDVYRFTVGYAFFRNQNVEVGGAIGVHGTDFDIELAGEASVSGTPAVGGVVRRKKVFVPLPTVGVFGTVNIMPRWVFNARVDYLSLSIDQYDGRLLNAQGAVSYRAMNNLDIGAMWRKVDYRLGIQRDRWQGQVRYRFSGPALFARLAF
jgi:hypothetical protein